ncbi:MAG: tetraacyldisaccharide 4'-kinase, partial [Candidatus Omnitrophota bacterium]|nr:tetraacyldisaccharide 4'-kinase [Candidatus Omnitrophota bacterium]
TGKEAVKKHSLDTLLLDDGFQYRRLKRDLDIVCIDALNPFGNGWVIPTGSMREGFESLKRADVFVLTRVDLVKYQAALENLKLKLKSINQGALIVKSVHEATHVYKLLNEQLVDMEFLKKKKIVLLSAIGNPMAFEKTVLNLGLEVKIHFVFRDHHEYTKQDIERIVSFCSKNKIEKIITTEKDAIKLRDVVCDLQDTDVLVLSIKLKVIENEQAFYNRLFGSRSS